MHLNIEVSDLRMYFSYMVWCRSHFVSDIFAYHALFADFSAKERATATSVQFVGIFTGQVPRTSDEGPKGIYHILEIYQYPKG